MYVRIYKVGRRYKVCLNYANHQTFLKGEPMSFDWACRQAQKLAAALEGNPLIRLPDGRPWRDGE